MIAFGSEQADLMVALEDRADELEMQLLRRGETTDQHIDELFEIFGVDDPHVQTEIRALVDSGLMRGRFQGS